MKNRIDRFNSDHMQNIKNRFEEETGVQLTPVKLRKRNKFRVAVTAVVVFCILAGTPVLAANVPEIYRLMYLVSPDIAQFFMPVKLSDEDEGIKMEVISTYIHDGVVEAYVTIQDLAQDRIDDTTDLYDSYSINRPFDSAASCQYIGYDETTKKATFLITITEWENQKILGKKITFSIKEIISHKKNYEGIEVSTKPVEWIGDSKTQEVYSIGGGGEYAQGNDMKTVLVPSTEIAFLPEDVIQLSAIGYIDNQLHVQMAIKDRLALDHHGRFYLEDEKGNQLYDSANVYFTNQYEQASDRIDYCEYIFDVPQAALSDYKLLGDFVTTGLKISGDWQVTFPLK